MVAAAEENRPPPPSVAGGGSDRNRMFRNTAAALAILTVAVLAARDSVFNFGKTLEWEPGNTVQCNSIAEVVAAVENAKAASQRVKALGTGWSWSTTLASNGDTYVELSGALADAEQVDINIDTATSTATATVGAGVSAFDLYMQLQPTGYNIEAKGNCLTAQESQTIGGLLATNVHHTGVRTFFDVVEWVDVVTARDGLVRTFRNETLFRLTIGGGGRTGVIVRVQFMLAPRATYMGAGGLGQPQDDTFEAFFQGYADLVRPFAPMEFIGLGLRAPGIVGSQVGGYSGSRRMAEPSANPQILPADYGDLRLAGKAFVVMDRLVDRVLPSRAYNLWYLAGLGAILNGRQPNDSGTTGFDLDVACSDSNTPNLKHNEIEFYVPIDLVTQVGAFLDNRFQQGCYPYVRDFGLFALRSVFGCNSLTAANGVLSDGSTPDLFIAVNIDSYQRKRWKQYNGELNALMSDLSTEFPQQIRTHPGKYNPMLSPDPESQTVKDLIAEFDPEGIFARDDYDPTFLTATPDVVGECQ